MSEFVENGEAEVEKQDCERNAAKRLIKRLKEAFPHLPIILCADSLYACASFFEQCAKYRWKYLVNFREGSIPTIATEYKALKQREGNRREIMIDGISYWFDYVSGIDYQGYKINIIERGVVSTGSSCYILTDLPVTQRNVTETVKRARWRWKIENEGFNVQKNHGYFLGHIFCYDGTAFKNHYYLIQIGHMIAQIMDAWASLWSGVKISLEQKHRRLLESWKTDLLSTLPTEHSPPFQIHFS